MIDLNGDDEFNPNWDCIDKLLNQAYLQNDNLDDVLVNDNEGARRRARFRPAGNISVFDTRLNANIGFEGVKVRARRWFTVYTARPNIDGDFVMRRTFNRPCNYSAYFSGSRFTVRRNMIGIIHWINGPKITGNWNHTIANGYSRFAAHVFRGAWRYNFKDIADLRRPYGPVSTLFRQQYVAVDDDMGGASGVNWMFVPIIRIARYSDGEPRREFLSDEVFSTTCHETAHTTHALKMPLGLAGYILVERALQESWAVAVEWVITHLEYSERGIINYGLADYNPLAPPTYPNRFAYQYWSMNLNTNSDKYTSLYINIIDDFNEFGQFFLNNLPTGSVNDELSGYTIAQVETSVIPLVINLNALSWRLKSIKPVGVTDAQIDNLLLSYY